MLEEEDVTSIDGTLSYQEGISIQHITSQSSVIISNDTNHHAVQKYGSGMNPERIDLLNQMQFDWNGPLSHQSNDDFGNKSSEQ